MSDREANEQFVVTGFVVRVFENGPFKGRNKNTEYFTYSIKVEDKDGNEDPLFYRFGTENPKLKEGDYIRFSAIPNDEQSAKADLESLKIGKNPPARTAPAASSSGPKGGSGYNSEAQRADRAYHAARANAISTVALLLTHEALPTVNKKTSEDGKASRYAAITNYIDKLTVINFRDEIATGFDDTYRLLATVKDVDRKASKAVDPVPQPDDDDEGGLDFDSTKGGDTEDGDDQFN